ncbi:hypothetical protein [Persicobacter psychrovividus]|uniref:Lipoprotein n=1 Tax=Persicobacter psychrovividus TaxID=387638 RepID=A0ABM7VJ03_9BACT|nr:hypothetical protein PEPS_30450 [Persicobacter psychrovividus]
MRPTIIISIFFLLTLTACDPSYIATSIVDNQLSEPIIFKFYASNRSIDFRDTVVIFEMENGQKTVIQKEENLGGGHGFPRGIDSVFVITQNDAVKWINPIYRDETHHAKRPDIYNQMNWIPQNGNFKDDDYLFVIDHQLFE